MSDLSSRMPSGRAVLGTAIRLVIASLIVGALLAIFNLNPIEMWRTAWTWVENGIVDLFGTGLQGIALVLTLIATGAIIVVPIWLVKVLLKRR